MSRTRTTSPTDPEIRGLIATENAAKEQLAAATAARRAAEAKMDTLARESRAAELAMRVASTEQDAAPMVTTGRGGTVGERPVSHEATTAVQRAALAGQAEAAADDDVRAAREHETEMRERLTAATRARRVGQLLAEPDAASVREAHAARAAAREEVVAADTARTQALAALEHYHSAVDNGAPRDPVRRLECEAAVADAADRVTVATRRVAVTTDAYRDAVLAYLTDAVDTHRRSRRVAEATAAAVADQGLKDLVDKISAGVQVGNEHGRRLAALRDDAQIRPDSIAGPEGALDPKSLLRSAITRIN